MSSVRGTSVWVGLSFLIATAAFIVADGLVTSVLAEPGFPGVASAHVGALAAGALLAFVDGVAVVGIAVLLFPLLKGTSEPLALGYVALRVGELGAILLYMATPLLALALAGGEPVDPASTLVLGSLLTALHGATIRLLYLFTSTAGLALAWLLLRSGLVPRALSILGLIGYPVLLVGAMLDVFGWVDVTRGIGMVSVVPGGLFELLLPIWLLARGFSAATRAGATDAA